MIDLLDRTIETTPELENDYIGDIIKKIQKPADKVRAYAASVGLPENQIVLPFQVLAALYEFNLNNGLRLNEADYLETITKCAYKTVDFILATNNYFGDIESYAIPIQLHIDGLFIRHLINIIVSYFPNLLPEVQQNMRRMLLFQLTQTIFNLGKGEKSILTPVLKQSELFQNVSLKNKRGGAADEITVPSDELPPSSEIPPWNVGEFGATVQDFNDASVENVIVEVPEIGLVEREYVVRPLVPPTEDQYAAINIYGLRLPGNLGVKDPDTGTLYILDLSSEKAANNFRDLLQSFLNEEYNRNPRARHLIDSIILKVYHDKEGFLHIDGLPEQYLKYIEKAIEHLIPSARDNTYYFVPAKNFNSRTPNPMSKFTVKPHLIETRNPEQGPNLADMAKNSEPYDLDPEINRQQLLWKTEHNANEAEQKAEEERAENLKKEQQKLKQELAKKHDQIADIIRRIADYNKYAITDEEIENMINAKFVTADLLMKASAGRFVINTINTTAEYEYDLRFTQSMEFLSNLDDIANSGNLTSVYEQPSWLGIVSYEALGTFLMQSAYWWNTFVNNFFSVEAVEEVYRAKKEAANDLVKRLSMGETKDDYLKLNSDLVQRFQEAMQGDDEMAQGLAAQALLDSIEKKKGSYISKADAQRIAGQPIAEVVQLLPEVIKDGVRVSEAIVAAQTTGTFDEVKTLIGAKLIKWGGTAVLFCSGTYFVYKGAYLAWKKATGNAFNLQHIDPQVFNDYGWPIQEQKTQEQFSGDFITRIPALAIHYNRLVAAASAAAGKLPEEVIDHIEKESNRYHYPFHLKCMLYIKAAALYAEYVEKNTPKVPELLSAQFDSMRKELEIYNNTTIPAAIVTLEAENAFFAHLETHIDNLPLIERMVSLLNELEKLYEKRENVTRILEQQKATFPLSRVPKFQEELQRSTTNQLEILNTEKQELDNRYNAGVVELSKEYGISKEEVDTLLRSSTIFEQVASAFTQVTVKRATKEASRKLQEREEQGEVQQLNFEEHAKKYITDWGLNWLRNFFFEHSEHGWDNKFEKFIEAGNIHNSIGLATSILAFLCGFGGGIAYLKSLWSDEPPGWIAQMLLFIGSGYVTYISASTVAAFTAIGVAHWLSIAIASTIGLFFSLGITGRIAVTTAVKLWKGFKAGSLLWRWASGRAGISEEKADAIAEAASIGATALTGALSNGFSELLSPLKLPNAAVNLGSQILPRPIKPLLTPIKTITEPLSNFADRRIKANTSKMPELSQKSMEAIFPWMKKTTEEKPKVEEEKEKPKENAPKQNDSVQKIDPSRIPTRDGKSTEPVSSKKLKTKPVKAKAPSKTTKQKARVQTKDSRKKQVAKLVLKPRAKLTLKVEKPTPKKKKVKPTSSKKRVNPLIDLYKIFSSASPSKKPRLF